MKRALRIAITIITLIAICIAFRKVIQIEKRTEFKQATGFEDLEIAIPAGGGKEYIVKPQADSEGRYCFFLPFYAAGKNMYFDNLTGYAQLYLNGGNIKGGETLPRDILDGKESDAELRFGTDRTEKCSLSFVILQDADIVFLETSSGSMERIDLDKNNSESGKMTVVASDGKIRCSGDVKKISLKDKSEAYGEDGKSYKINLAKKATPVPGAERADEWVLIPNPDGTSQAVFSTAGLFGEDTVPQGISTDVYANGRYLGRYFLCEKAESIYKALKLNDLNRDYKALNNNFSGRKVRYLLNPDRTARGAKAENPADITGGYLVERTVFEKLSNTSSFFVTDSGTYYKIIYPKKASLEMAEYLRVYFNEMEAAVFSERGVNETTGKSISDYLDIESWAEKYVIEQYFSEAGSHIESTYLYKYSDETDTHIYFGPYRDTDADPEWAEGTDTIYADELLKRPEVTETVTEKSKLIDDNTTTRSDGK